MILWCSLPPFFFGSHLRSLRFSSPPVLVYLWADKMGWAPWVSSTTPAPPGRAAHPDGISLVTALRPEDYQKFVSMAVSTPCFFNFPLEVTPLGVWAAVLDSKSGQSPPALCVPPSPAPAVLWPCLDYGRIISQFDASLALDVFSWILIPREIKESGQNCSAVPNLPGKEKSLQCICW